MSRELDINWFKERLTKHKNGSRPGMTVNLTTSQAEKLVSHIEELETLKEGMLQELADAEGELASGLEYPYDKERGWVTGEHTTVTLAMEARRKIEDLELMRGISIDVLAFLEANEAPPDFMVQAFTDALQFMHPQQSKEGDVRDTDDG